MTLLEILNAAKAHSVGVAAMCESIEAADDLRRRLYMLRAKLREQGDNSFDSLSLSVAPSSSDVLYIYTNPEFEAKKQAQELLDIAAGKID